MADLAPMHAASAAPADRASALPRAAARHDLTVVARGGGTTLAWGAPPRRCDLVVDTLLLDQVHAAGGLGQVWRG